MLKIDEWIRKGQGEDGQQFTQETYPHRGILIGMMNEIPISSQGPKGGNTKCLQDAERNAAYFGKFKLGTLCVLVQVQKNLEFLKNTPKNQEENGTTLQDKVTDVYRGPKHPILKECKSFPKRTTKARRQKHALQRWSRISEDDNKAHMFSQWPLYALVNFCLSWTIETGQPWKSPRFGSIVLNPRISELASLSQAPVADDISDYAWLALGTNINSWG